VIPKLNICSAIIELRSAPLALGQDPVMLFELDSVYVFSILKECEIVCDRGQTGEGVHY
jgi:hypothetical protein